MEEHNDPGPNEVRVARDEDRQDGQVIKADELRRLADLVLEEVGDDPDDPRVEDDVSLCVLVRRVAGTELTLESAGRLRQEMAKLAQGNEDTFAREDEESTG